MTKQLNHQIDAVDWYVKLSSDDVSQADKQAWARWLNQSEQNEIAWQEIKQTLSKFQSVPSDVGMSVLSRKSNNVDLNRRATLKHIGLFAAISLPVGILLKDNLTDKFYDIYSTKIGERKQLVLADGTTLALNTNTSVTVNLSSTERVIKLHQGEILIITGHNKQFDKPLLIETRNGNIIPIGTKFNVRQFNAFTRVSLFEGKLELTPKYHDLKFNMNANQEVDMFSSEVVYSTHIQKLSDAWLNGYMEVDNLTLKIFIEELSRYQHGYLICHPDIANIKISGSYSLDNIDISLNSLSQTFPVKIQHATRFLTMVLPASD